MPSVMLGSCIESDARSTSLHELTAVNVAGRKTIVIAAMTRMAALSRDAARVARA